MPNHAHHKLGKQSFTPKAKDLKLKAYVDKAALIDSGQVPPASSWTAMLTPSNNLPQKDTDPLGNDEIGLCVYAGPGHMVKLISQQTGVGLTVTRQQVVDAYAEDTGYDPVTGANDNGAVIRDMLKRWQSKGLYGTKALAYALVDYTDPDEVAIASWLGCGTIGGYALPLASQKQVDSMGRQIWFLPDTGFPKGQGPGTWGGHCIYETATSPAIDGGNSWGDNIIWTPEWRQACQDECWIVLVDAWKLVTGRAPNGFAWEQLLADVAARTA